MSEVVEDVVVAVVRELELSIDYYLYSLLLVD